MQRSTAYRWSLIIAPLLACILIPFAVFGAQTDAWTLEWLRQQSNPWLAFGAIVLLLAADVLLPIPSSIIATMSGVLLGVSAGTVATWLGMTVGSVLAYVIGAFAGRTVVARITGPAVLEALERDMARLGVRLVAVGRAVPVLAETTTLIAGLVRMSFPLFVTVVSLANLGVSFIYASVGAFAADVRSFLLALAASILLPAFTFWGAARIRDRLARNDGKPQPGRGD